MRQHNDEDRKRKEQEHKTLLRDYAATFGSAQGKRVLDDIISKAHFWNTTFTGNSNGMFKEGRRDLGLYIFKMTNKADSNITIDIMKDNQKLKLERDQDE